MKFMDALSAKVAAKNARVVFPEHKEPRTAEAMRALDRDGLCRPVTLGDNTERYVQALIETHGMKERIARRLVEKPLYRAAAMVAAGSSPLIGGVAAMIRFTPATFAVSTLI